MQQFISETVLWVIIKNCLRLKKEKMFLRQIHNSQQNAYQEQNAPPPPHPKSVKQNKSSFSSQQDSRMELINLSILCHDHWTEPHRGVHAHVHRVGGGAQMCGCVCVTHDIIEGAG